MQHIGQKYISNKDEDDREAPFGATSVSNSQGVLLNHIVSPISQRVHS